MRAATGDFDVVDTLGTSGSYLDPVWRLRVELTALEQDLLRCWWVRRLALVVHAGAAAISSAQSYSRLDHSLGLLALVAHFHPDDHLVRAAALVHDVGHLPLSHTFEGVAGLNHHQLGRERVAAMAPIFAAHGVDHNEVIARAFGPQTSALNGRPGTLRLDHLESWVRSGHAQGRTQEAPADTLSRLRLREGAVDTDVATAAYVVDLGIGELRSQTSTPNIVATGVVRYLAETLLGDLTDTQHPMVAAMTDHEFWALLLRHPGISSTARALLRDPAGWTVRPYPDGGDSSSGPGDIGYEVTRLYLDMPLVDGELLPRDDARLAGLRVPPWRCVIHRAGSPTRAASNPRNG